MAAKAGWDVRSWNKVARWAGIGNNREMEQDDMSDPQVEELNAEVLEQDQATRAVTEAGEEAGGLEAEVLQLRSERDQMKDRLARLQAEFDNFRKRQVQERQDARDYTVTSTVEPFLSVMDNFQLALKADGTAEQLRAGVVLILKQMDDSLKGLGVIAVETIGVQFDPRVHEALGSIETVEFPDHQVMEEIRKGYKIREKLLRPAMVRIASNPAQVAE